MRLYPNKGFELIRLKYFFDNRRSLKIIARSNELKAAGIPMGAPYFKYREQLEQMGAVVVSSNYTLYGDMSARVMDSIAQIVPALEIYSIDEAWLDLTGIDSDMLDAFARRIVATVRQHTGIPVSIGIGSTKVLAKIANRICKKRCIPGQVFNLWGIGRRLADRLHGQGRS